MDENSIIYTLFTTKRDVLLIIKDTKEMKEIFDVTLDLDKKIRKLLAEQPDILKLYDELEKAETEYLNHSEANTYYHGFKDGLKLAIECGLRID
ncbi:MAG: hypothetical protein K2N18_01665 [Clostridia bacterium]|nr:hypothetical protein [Clostridia bacterium]